ncbi:hypothetical protein EMN47_16030 [Prolixibacteraceae bacterium JC049]|nr:hypothetical protein [Prolixibacteraceae bacterium JC049]
MRRVIFLLILLGWISEVGANTDRKEILITRTEKAPQVDANLDDEAWKHAIAIGDFIQQSPANGAAPTEKSRVKLLYDNDALYVGAMLFDASPDSILTEFGPRDAGDELNADLFSIEINPWNDGRSSVEFMVSASGIQMDSQNTIESMNKSWNAVWQSKVRLCNEGWIVEMRIPFSELRFPNKEQQVWEMNLFRLIKRKNEGVTWNFVDKNIVGWLNQAGTLKGISGVKPKTRLSFYPYFSTYVSKRTHDNSAWSFKGGMDVKYGINESFTLDMMLIPDFGQVESDDQQLNLSPFETFYDEKRSFFTEGTEIFNKGDIFYSRRLGGTPSRRGKLNGELEKHEQVTENPVEAKLLNAVKLSGRTNKGLGVGFLNALTAKTYAEIEDTITGHTRKYLTQGVANYNMFVLDQSLGNQSYVSVANTYVTDPSATFHSIVSATEFKLTNKSAKYAISGDLAVSQNKKDGNNETGLRYNVKLSKIKGKFQFDLSHKTIDEQFNPNAMGFLNNNNEQSNVALLKYNNYKPSGNINEITHMLTLSHYSQHKPYLYAKFEMYGLSKVVFSNYSSAAVEWSAHPFHRYNYYEPRIAGRKYKEPTDIWVRLIHETDHRKDLALISRVSHWRASTRKSAFYWVELLPQFRVSNKVLLKYHFYYMRNNNNPGFAHYDSVNDRIYFVNRDIDTHINTIEGRWNFTQKSSLRVRARHYWSKVKHKEAYLLEQSGELANQSDFHSNNHINYNALNIDLEYNWEFAPGSELAIVWKNEIENSDSNISRNFVDNFTNVAQSDQLNSISMRVRYYIDWNQLKKRRRG